jgi:hypothetical protein
MTDLENAALAYVRARIDRDRTKRNLRAGWHLDPDSRDECLLTTLVWQDAGGYGGDVMSLGKTPSCHEQPTRDLADWCEVCTRRQALYLAHQSATRRMCGAWLHLRAVARKIGGEK